MVAVSQEVIQSAQTREPPQGILFEEVYVISAAGTKIGLNFTKGQVITSLGEPSSTEAHYFEMTNSHGSVMRYGRTEIWFEEERIITCGIKGMDFSLMVGPNKVGILDSTEMIESIISQSDRFNTGHTYMIPIYSSDNSHTGLTLLIGFNPTNNIITTIDLVEE